MGLFDGKSQGRFSYFRPKAVTAAAVVQSKETTDALKVLHQHWQSLAFGYYAKVGECWNPTQFYARSMAKLSVFVGEVGPDGEITPTQNQEVIDLFEPIRAAYGGEGGLGASYGRLKFLIGEGRLCQSRPPLPRTVDDATYQAALDEPPVWEFLSPTELAVKDEGNRIVRSPGSGAQGIEYRNISDDPEAGEPAPGEMRMWRFWRKHPQYSMQADSPVRAVLDLYEQLWWVTMGERADIQNRIANAGLVLIPREIDLELSDAEVEALGEDPDADPFMVRLAGLWTTAVEDPGSAGAAVPGVIRAPSDLLHPDKFRHIRFYDPQSSLFASQREEALIKRIGIGLDLPLEEITGLSQANHWTAWKIDDEKWAHIQPVAQAFCDDVWQAVMRPILLANGVGDPDVFVVAYDNTDLVTDPDKGKTAIALHETGGLRTQAMLEANGFDPDEDMLIDPDEIALWLQLHGETATPAPSDQAPADTQEPQTEDQQGGGNNGNAPAEQAEIRGIAEFAVDRAREMAGAKVRGLRRRCEECFSGMEDVPNRALIAALGPEKLERIGAPAPATLVAGIVNSFLFTCERMGHEITPELAASIEHHAAETLFVPYPPPLPEDVIAALVVA